MYTPNVLINTRIDNEEDMAIIKIRGLLLDILLNISPDLYGPYFITDSKGVKQLIFQCQNKIYGTIKARLLYYKKFRKSLEYEGYGLIHYVPCITNMIIKGSQMNVCFHVYD